MGVVMDSPEPRDEYEGVAGTVALATFCNTLVRIRARREAGNCKNGMLLVPAPGCALKVIAHELFRGS